MKLQISSSPALYQIIARELFGVRFIWQCYRSDQAGGVSSSLVDAFGRWVRTARVSFVNRGQVPGLLVESAIQKLWKYGVSPRIDWPNSSRSDHLTNDIEQLVWFDDPGFLRPHYTLYHIPHVLSLDWKKLYEKNASHRLIPANTTLWACR